MPAIHVRLILRVNRKFYEAQWFDPATGLKKTKTTQTAARREAERFAARLEDELNNPKRPFIEALTWDDFRKRYETAVYPSQAFKTKETTTSTFNAIEEYVGPVRTAQVDEQAILDLAEAIRSEGRAEATVKRHMSEVRKILNWGFRKKLIARVPDIDVPRNAAGMKGRPITGEEFDRMLKAVRKVVPSGFASWEFFLKGLWWSGLRLGESLALHWTDTRNLCVDLSGRRPMFHIQAHAEKGRKHRALPMAPEFAQLLEAVPERERRGFVFSPKIPRSSGRPLQGTVSKFTSRIGKKAGILVSEKNGKEKFASAHDLRRAFGFRWSQRVLPPVLMELMRHESIQTTMQFYVGRNAEMAADQAWSAWESSEQQNGQTKAQSGNTSGNTRPKRPPRLRHKGEKSR